MSTHGEGAESLETLRVVAVRVVSLTSSLDRTRGGFDFTRKLARGLRLVHVTLREDLLAHERGAL